VARNSTHRLKQNLYCGSPKQNHSWLLDRLPLREIILVRNLSKDFRKMDLRLWLIVVFKLKFLSYTNNEFRDNKYKNERSFGYFFITNKEFNVFSKGGLELKYYENN